MKKYYDLDKITPEMRKKFQEDFKKYIQKQVMYDKRQFERISKFMEKLSDKEIDIWADKFIKWENNYEIYQYDYNHVQTQSRILDAVTEYCKQNGKEIRIRKDEDFCTLGFKWKKYTFKLYQGQGAFWRIWKGKKVIFTSV